MKTVLRSALSILSAIAVTASANAQSAAGTKQAPKPVTAKRPVTPSPTRDLSFVSTDADNRAAMVLFTAQLKADFPWAIESIESTFNDVDVFEMFAGIARARGINPNNLKDIAALYLTISWMIHKEQDASDTVPNRAQLVGTGTVIDQLVRNNHRAFAGDAKARRTMAQQMIGKMARTEWRLSNAERTLVKMAIRSETRKEVLEMLGLDLADYELTAAGLVKKLK